MQHTTTTRANRIPRIAPAKPGLCRRLHIHLQQFRLLRQLDTLGEQADDVEKRLKADTSKAHALSKLFRRDPAVDVRRAKLRIELDALIKQANEVRKQLDDLSAELG